MINIISKPIEFETELKKKIEFICDFCNTKPKIINGNIRNTTSKTEHIQKYIIFPAIISTKDAYEGLVLKGVGEDFDSLKFSDYLKSGFIPDYGNPETISDIVISKYEQLFGYIQWWCLNYYQLKLWCPLQNLLLLMRE